MARQAELAEQSASSATEIAHLQSELDALSEANERLTQENTRATETDNASRASRGIVQLEDENSRLRLQVQQLTQKERAAVMGERVAQEQITRLQGQVERQTATAANLSQELAVSKAGTQRSVQRPTLTLFF